MGQNRLNGPKRYVEVAQKEYSNNKYYVLVFRYFIDIDVHMDFNIYIYIYNYLIHHAFMRLTCYERDNTYT